MINMRFLALNSSANAIDIRVVHNKLVETDLENLALSSTCKIVKLLFELSTAGFLCTGNHRERHGSGTISAAVFS
jgi:hypothetical protein